MGYVFNCSSLFKINAKNGNFQVENCRVLVFAGYNAVPSSSTEQPGVCPIVSLWACSFLKFEERLCVLKHQRADALF